MTALVVSTLVFWMIVIMYLAGFFGMMEKKNFIKKIMAMNLMQTAVILFFLTLSYNPGGLVPILLPSVTNIAEYINPLTHALMLTAIVVNLSTTGVALALLIILKKHWGTIEEDELIRRMNK